MRLDLNNGWHVEKNPKPIPDRRCDWDFWNDDERCGYAISLMDALEQIAEMENEKA